MNVCEHLSAVGESGAACENFGAAFERTPLDDADFNVATTPLIHERVTGLVEVNGARAG